MVVISSIAVDRNYLHSGDTQRAVDSRLPIAAGTSQSTNFRLTQGKITLKFPLMGMVYSRGKIIISGSTILLLLLLLLLLIIIIITIIHSVI